LNIEVVGVSLPPIDGSLYSRANRQGKIREEFVDIREASSLRVLVEKIKPSGIFHLAAQPLVLESYKAPLQTFETNVMGTANLLDAAFKVDSTKFIICATTDKVYKNEEKGIRFKESDSLAGKDPYSASKVGAEAVISAWQQISRINSGPRVVSVRAGNVIGGGDFSEDRLLPDIIRGFTYNSQVVIRNPKSTRPWQHVLDPLFGYVMTAQSVLLGTKLDSINFGPDEKSLSVHEVVEIVNSEGALGRIPNLEIQSVTENANTESQLLDLDSSLAQNKIGWKPAWSQKDAIKATLNWWDQVLNHGVTCEQACKSDLSLILK
jgi:CDP-glucose 4,6-dehydratase